MKRNIGVLASIVTLALVAVACADGEGLEADVSNKLSYDASEYAPRESAAKNAVKEKEKTNLEGKGSVTLPFNYTHHQVVWLPKGATVKFRTHGATSAHDPIIALYRDVDNSWQMKHSARRVDIKELALNDDLAPNDRNAEVSWTNNVDGFDAVNVHVLVFAFEDRVQSNFGDIQLSQDGGTPYDIIVTAGSSTVPVSAGHIWTSGSVAAPQAYETPYVANPWLIAFAGENSAYNDNRVVGGGLESDINGFANGTALVVAYGYRDLAKGTTTINF
jgi:hypothetical protein